jgi:uncharacterized protein (DUF433 family)
MSSYSLNLPQQLKREAEQLAVRQGVSLDQFILWAVAEKVGECKQQLDDPAFPLITYRRGAGGGSVPVLHGTGIRVQAIVIAAQNWQMCPAEIASEYQITEAQVNEALAFYKLHAQEIDAALAAEQRLENAHG